METSTPHQTFKVGLFLFIGLIAILVTILTLGANKNIFTPVIRTHSFFDSVQGINEGSVVSYSGIVVGNVERVEFDSERKKVRISLKIDQNQAKIIAFDSTLEIKTQGALGDKYIYITPGESEKKIEDGMEISVQDQGDFLGTFAKRGNEAEKIFDILNNLNTLTKQLISENKIDKITNNLLIASQNISKASVHTEKLTSDLQLKPTIEKLDRILNKIDQGQGTLGGLINDPSIHNQLKSFLGASQKKNHLKNILKMSVDTETE